MRIDKLRLLHRIRWASQIAMRPRVSIAGGYHFGNLGDMALGQCVAEIIGQPNRDLQTIYNLGAWPTAEATIVGGGAVIHKATLQQLVDRHKKSPEKLAILGVDIEDFDAIRSELDFLNALAFISVRSSRQRRLLADLGLRNVRSHPDICFTLLAKARRSGKKAGRFGFNVSPRFFAKHMESPETRTKYRALLRALLEMAKGLGLRLHHYSFTSTDDVFARTVFSEAEVTFHKYSPNVSRMLKWIGECDLFFASRFHSIIFSLVSGTPTIPFLYADKSYRLLEDIGLGDAGKYGYKELRQNDCSHSIRWLQEYAPIVAEPRMMSLIGDEVRKNVLQARAALGASVA